MNLLDLLFPKKCLGCGVNEKYICDTCFKKVKTYNTVDKNNYSVFRYEGVIRKAIVSLKYKFAFDVSNELTACIVQNIRHNPKFLPLNSNLTLVPIPLHKHRENWRGFNQTEIIGEKLAKAMNWDYLPSLLIKNKNTKPQVGLKGVSRYKNLSNVFVLNPAYKKLEKGNNNILIFDDVYTTGSTINEVKKVLLEANFTNILSLTVAR